MWTKSFGNWLKSGSEPRPLWRRDPGLNFLRGYAKNPNQGPAYPGVSGHGPSAAKAHQAAEHIDRCMNHLRALVPNPGSYVSESNYFEKDWQQSYWGTNYQRLADIKRKYDPDGLFFVHNGVGSEQWSTDGFTKLVP
jgi:hypothetical protein